MALNLKNEIDRLNNNKEKTKRVATNIDNKLVELGGQVATDLADVPNKIGSMIRENYKKIAFFDYVNNPIKIREGEIAWNLDFNPSKLIVCVSYGPDGITKFPYNTVNLIPNHLVDLGTTANNIMHIVPASSEFWKGKVTRFDKNGMAWSERQDNSAGKDFIKITYIIAIE